MNSGRSMAGVIRAHPRGGTDPATWSPGQPIRWVCFGPDCEAAEEGTDMRLSLTAWYAGHLADELEKAGFGDVRGTNAAGQEDRGHGFGIPDPAPVPGDFVRPPASCDGSESCPAHTHGHGCVAASGDVFCDEHGENCSEAPAVLR